MSEKLLNKNIPFMLAYSLDINFQVIKDCIGSEDENLQLQKLLLRITLNLFEKLVYLGNIKRYQAESKLSSKIIGRVNFLETQKKVHSERKDLWSCTYSKNSPRNQRNFLICSVLYSCLKMEIDGTIRDQLLSIISLFNFSNYPTKITPLMIRNMRSSETNKDYIRIWNVLEYLVMTITLSGKCLKENLSLDVEEKLLPYLFENFLFNFYKDELKNKKVYRKILDWAYFPIQNDQGIMPVMRPDIIVEDEVNVLILDAKCYRNYLTEGYYNQTIRSSHLYQIESYLNNIDSPLIKHGILIYPDNFETNVHKFFDGQKYLIVSTVPIAGSWEELKQSLLSLIHIELSLF